MFDSDLIGVWVVDDSDISAKERYGSVSMTFTDDGSLEYIIHAEGGRQQKIWLFDESRAAKSCGQRHGRGRRQPHGKESLHAINGPDGVDDHEAQLA
jgi:hypothetical protein